MALRTNALTALIGRLRDPLQLREGNGNLVRGMIAMPPVEEQCASYFEPTTRRQVLTGASQVAALVLPIGRPSAPRTLTKLQLGQSWADGTYWRDGTGWAE